MTTTGQQIIDAAYARSTAARVDTAATDGVELLGALNQALLARFQLAARVAPATFGAVAAVSFTTDSWPFPSGALTVFRVEGGTATLPAMTAGTPVSVVALEDRLAFAGQPSVYAMGRKLYGAGNSGDPTAGELSVWYTPSPTTLGSLASNIDATWPESFNALLELPVAIYLARKDERTVDQQAFEAEESRWLALFDAWLRGQVTGMESRFGDLRIGDQQPQRDKD